MNLWLAWPTSAGYEWVEPLLLDTGAKSARVAIGYPGGSGPWTNWSSIDTLVQWFVTKQIKMEVIVFSNDSTSTTYDWDGPFRSTTARTNMMNWVRALVARYSGNGYVRTFELFNEPNAEYSQFGLSATQAPVTFTQDMAAFYSAVHDNCATCVALNGPFALNFPDPEFNRNWLQRAFDAGLNQYTDALNVNFYHGDQWGIPRYADGTPQWTSGQKVNEHLSAVRSWMLAQNKGV
ncbi:MAG TPA: hypothetical protein VGE04_12070, partial [Chloroflexia bacterium]